MLMGRPLDEVWFSADDPESEFAFVIERFDLESVAVCVDTDESTEVSPDCLARIVERSRVLPSRRYEAS
jgi:hypothetical protein